MLHATSKNSPHIFFMCAQSRYEPARPSHMGHAWKSTINYSRCLRRLMSWTWKLPFTPSGKSYHKNTSTRLWQPSPSTYCAWLPVGFMGVARILRGWVRPGVDAGFLVRGRTIWRGRRPRARRGRLRARRVGAKSRSPEGGAVWGGAP